MSELKLVYKVDVNTGEEQLVRSAGFKGLVINDLRKIEGATSEKIVFNTTGGEDIQHEAPVMNGCPMSLITPEALLFREIEVNKSIKPGAKIIPAVKSPLEL